MYHEQTPRQGWQEQQQIALKKKKRSLIYDRTRKPARRRRRGHAELWVSDRIVDGKDEDSGQGSYVDFVLCYWGIMLW